MCCIVYLTFGVQAHTHTQHTLSRCTKGYSKLKRTHVVYEHENTQISQHMHTGTLALSYIYMNIQYRYARRHHTQTLYFEYIYMSRNQCWSHYIIECMLILPYSERELPVRFPCVTQYTKTHTHINIRVTRR